MRRLEVVYKYRLIQRRFNLECIEPEAMTICENRAEEDYFITEILYLAKDKKLGLVDITRIVGRRLKGLSTLEYEFYTYILTRAMHDPISFDTMLGWFIEFSDFEGLENQVDSFNQFIKGYKIGHGIDSHYNLLGSLYRGWND